METIRSILTLVTPNRYMAKLDIKDADYSIHILSEHQKYLKFCFRVKLYQITCLPNGLCLGPSKFAKLLRLKQVTVARFIDDLIILDRGFVECEKSFKLIVTLFDSLGFAVHRDRSIFVPTRLIE